jgi:hypothetical protein
MISVHPVAHGGTEANIGAKNIDKMKQSPVVTAVKPVLPPSAIPAPDSMNAVTRMCQHIVQGIKLIVYYQVMFQEELQR